MLCYTLRLILTLNGRNISFVSHVKYLCLHEIKDPPLQGQYIGVSCSMSTFYCPKLEIPSIWMARLPVFVPRE
jgi:hypothetical protein